MKNWDTKRIYVWFEACTGYLSATIQWAREHSEDPLEWERWFPSTPRHSRTREIGIRTAIGADRRTILLLISGQAMPMILPGLVAGAILAYLMMPYFAVPFDFTPHDPAMLAAVVILFAGIALAALVPARRAARIDPLVALRYE